MPKVLVSLPQELLRRIDLTAERRGETRSALLTRAALAEVDGRTPLAWDPVAARGLRLILQRSEHRRTLRTTDALRARDVGRR